MSKMKDEDKIPVKKIRKRKPRNHPKRPLSAYNFFFRDERSAIVNAINNADKKTDKAKKGAEKPEGDTEYEVFLDDETIARLKNTKEGRVSFEEIGKLIGQNWKYCSPQRMAKYAEMAKEDSERYKKEMLEYTLRKETRIQMRRDDAYSFGGYPESYATGSLPSAGYQDFRLPSGPSAFSQVMPPASYPSYEAYSHSLGQQSMYPSQHSRRGVDPRYGMGGTSLSAAQYALGIGGMTSSSMYASGASGTGGYGYR